MYSAENIKSDFFKLEVYFFRQYEADMCEASVKISVLIERADRVL